MAKRIVVLRKEEHIVSASESVDFTPAEDLLERAFEPAGWRFDKTFSPVSLNGRMNNLITSPVAEGFDYRDMSNVLPEPELYIVRVDVQNEESFQSSLRQKPDMVVGFFSDLPIAPEAVQVYCGRPAVGTWENVYEKLEMEGIGYTGKNVKVAIVDTGIATDEHIRVAGGWTPSDVVGNPGEWPRDHGTMCAFDLLIGAPDAQLYDYALLNSNVQPIHELLISDAIACFSHLSDFLRTNPGPLVVSNSWGVYNRQGDYPIGHPSNYSANINHPFNQIALTLVAQGADVLFSAGNCGGDCPSMNCGTNDRGIGRSIHGVKAVQDVITVAAVTVDNRRLGYSAQGPGGISTRKPDIAAYSHFVGSGVYPADRGGDSGTSTACPVAAGIVAAIREKVSNTRLDPYALKAILQRTAVDLDNNGWDHDIGWGVINPKKIFEVIGE